MSIPYGQNADLCAKPTSCTNQPFAPTKWRSCDRVIGKNCWSALACDPTLAFEILPSATAIAPEGAPTKPLLPEHIGYPDRAAHVGLGWCNPRRDRVVGEPLHRAIIEGSGERNVHRGEQLFGVSAYHKSDVDF